MTTEPTKETRRARWLLGVAGLLLVPLAAVWWPGCRQYDPVTSRDALKLLQLLYTACNTKDPVRLGQVETGLERLSREGKLSPGERIGFDRILRMARSGEWSQAEAAAMTFARDQVGVGHPDPHAHEDEARTRPNAAGRPALR